MKQMVDSRLLNTNFHSTLFVQGVCIDWLRVLQSLVWSLLAFTAYHITRGKVNLSGTRNKTTTIIKMALTGSSELNLHCIIAKGSVNTPSMSGRSVKCMPPLRSTHRSGVGVSIVEGFIWR